MSEEAVKLKAEEIQDAPIKQQAYDMDMATLHESTVGLKVELSDLE